MRREFLAAGLAGLLGCVKHTYETSSIKVEDLRIGVLEPDTHIIAQYLVGLDQRLNGVYWGVFEGNNDNITFAYQKNWDE